ncbi:hypothetical protein [Paeniglutamicibacter kerguelensis]|nr:hypothetical protein [Paeniglutamicibacter kerguelensis]
MIRLLTQMALMVGNGPDSAPSMDEKPQEDIKASILKSGIAHFATEGFSKPSLDEIAHAAGVNASDVVELFENRDGLRQACDESVLQTLVRWAHEKATLEGMNEVMHSYMVDPGSYQMQMSYLGRVVRENGSVAARFVDVLVDESEAIIKASIIDGIMRPSDDPRALAVLVATTALGMIIMAPHIERILGLPASQQQMLRRLAMPALELYTYGLYTNDSYLKLVREAISTLNVPPQDSQIPDA